MNYVYSNQFVYREQAFLKDYDTFKEVILLKSCRLSGYELIGNSKKITDSDEVKRCSISRSKRIITDLCLMNNFQYFFTQTINDNYNRYDLDEFKNVLLKSFKAYKRKYPEFIYLIIFEKHKNGAYHCHGVLGGIDNLHLVFNENDYLNFSFLNFLGYNSLSKIKDKIKISYYITKYLTKDFVKTSSNISYFHSKGLLLPIIKKCNINDFDNLQLVFENDFIKKFRRI